MAGVYKVCLDKLTNFALAAVELVCGVLQVDVSVSLERYEVCKD